MEPSDSYDASKMFSLGTNLACIEAKLILEDHSPLEIPKEKASLLSSCFEIMEKMLSLLTSLSNNHNSALPWNPDHLLQARTTFQAAFHAVLESLLAAKEAWESGSEQVPKHPVVQSSARILSVWFSEEEVSDIRLSVTLLPLLLQICSEGFSFFFSSSS